MADVTVLNLCSLYEIETNSSSAKKKVCTFMNVYIELCCSCLNRTCVLDVCFASDVLLP